jgi:L-ascorbate metabolism protein UlaG (beta-lactamase superfamily)
MSSSNDAFHSDGAGVPGTPMILDALEIAREGGSRGFDGVAIEAIEAQESVVHKADPDANAMYVLTVDGLRIGHMGDMGNPLTPEQLRFFHGVDVLLALAGGPPTIELADLAAAIAAIQPRLVIPMHYRIPDLRLNILPLDALISHIGAEQIEIRPETTLRVQRERLPARTRFVALQPLANAAGYPEPGAAWEI